jgi:predicted Zn-dependent peptidase
MFYVYAGTDAASFARLMKALVKETRSLKKDGIRPDELQRAKAHLKGNLILSLESSSSRMNRVARQEMRFGEFFSIDDMLASIDRVRPEEVETMIHRVLDEDQMAVMSLGPVDRRNLPRDFPGA